MDNTYGFIERLSTKEPTPGGGGAGALLGAVAAALCQMVANLTSGKKKYAQYQEDIERIIKNTDFEKKVFLALIDKDAEGFYPLSRAYSIPKDEPGRAEILEQALVVASQTPLEILKECDKLLGMLEELTKKGSVLAISDVGVAAAACRAAADGAALSVYANTKLMKNREQADGLNEQTMAYQRRCRDVCDKVYDVVFGKMGL